MTTTTRAADAQTIPAIPRAEWAQHPHYPSQVLLLGSHANFCAVSAHLIADAEGVGSPDVMERLYRRWIAAMRSHERYEEHKLYPYLSRRWGASFDAAKAGHEALHVRHAVVIGAFDTLRDAEGDRDEARGNLVTALCEHDEVLRDHLRLEEDLVIPLLLALGPDEFRRYSYSSIGSLLRDLDERR